MKIFDNFRKQVQNIKRIKKELSLISNVLLSLAVTLISGLGDIERAIDHQNGTMKSHYDLRDSEQFLYNRAVKDTTARAEEVFGLIHANSSNGLYPSGNQLGRRPLSPEDFGAKDWNISPAEEKVTFSDHIINNGAFILVSGFSFNPKGTGVDLKGIAYSFAGVCMPYVPFGPKWISKHDGTMEYKFEQPVVNSPKSQINIDVYFVNGGINKDKCQLMVHGELIGKRSYLIKDPKGMQIEWPHKPDTDN